MIVWIMGSVCVLMFTKWCGWQSVWSSFYVVSVAHGIQIGMILLSVVYYTLTSSYHEVMLFLAICPTSVIDSQVSIE